MEREKQKRSIGSVEVTCQKFEAMRGLGLFSRLLRLFGPAIVEFIATGGRVNLVDSASLAQLFDRLEPAEMQSLARSLLEGSSAVVDGKQIDLIGDEKINLAFNGDVFDLLQACQFSVEVNFRRFLGLAAGAGNTPPAPEASK